MEISLRVPLSEAPFIDMALRSHKDLTAADMLTAERIYGNDGWTIHITSKKEQLRGLIKKYNQFNKTFEQGGAERGGELR